MRKSGVLSGDEVLELIRKALQGGDVRLLHHLDVVLLVASGRSCCEVANWFGVNRRTVERWVHAADVQVADGLAKQQQRSGRPPRLSGEQGQEIGLALLAAPCMYGYPERRWTGKRLALHLAVHYGLGLSVRSCQRLIAGSRDGPKKLRS
jgi:transposase